MPDFLPAAHHAFVFTAACHFICSLLCYSILFLVFLFPAGEDPAEFYAGHGRIARDFAAVQENYNQNFIPKTE
jgi:hypothetical protein